MACDTMTIHNVTLTQIGSLTNELLYNKFTVQALGSGFHIEGKGIRGNVVYNPLTQTLSIDIFSKPWYITCGRVRSTIQKYLKKDA